MEINSKKILNEYFLLFIVSLIFFVSSWAYQFYFFDDKIITKLLFSKNTEHQLYSYIKFLSSFDFNNSYNFKDTNFNNIPIPFGSLIFHSIFFMLFGDLGLVFIDFFGIYIFLIIFFLIFKDFTNKDFAIFFSIFLFTLPILLESIIGRNFIYLTQLTNDFYNLRVHRAFPSSLYLFGFILCLKELEKKDFKNSKLFLISGILLGLLLSSFYYFFFLCSLSFILLFVIKKKYNCISFIFHNYKNFIVMLISFIITCSPFIYFINTSETDILIASGVFELTIEKKKYLISYFFNKFLDLKFLILNTLILIFFIITNKYLNKSSKLLNIFLTIYISSILSPLIFFLISTRSGLIYHFSNSILLFAYLYLILSITFISNEFILKNLSDKIYRLTAILIIILYCTVQFNNIYGTKNNYKNQIRQEFDQVTDLINKKNFSREKTLLLSFDMSFIDWSVIKDKFKNLNLVYSTLTPRTFTEIENDLIDSFYFLNLEHDQFMSFLDNRVSGKRIYNPNVQKFMYMKYTANKLNRFQDTYDYDLGIKNYVFEASPMLSKQLAIPNFEIERLSKKFKSRKNIDITKPSIIIIDKTDELYEKISINENLYCKIYSKQIYEVFIKQNLKKC